jgi:hypothetical protein
MPDQRKALQPAPYYSRLRDSEKVGTAPIQTAGGLLPIDGEPRPGIAGPGPRPPRALREGERLAADIRAYWQERGYRDVLTDVGSVSRRSEGKAPVSAVRSNLVAGMPPAMAGHWRAPAPRARRP